MYLQRIFSSYLTKSKLSWSECAWYAIGSPSMEMGNNKEGFDTLLVFSNGTTRVFSSHGQLHLCDSPIITGAVCRVCKLIVSKFFILLFRFAIVGSTQATEMGWFTFGCFKHAYCNEYACKKDCVDCRTYAKHQVELSTY